MNALDHEIFKKINFPFLTVVGGVLLHEPVQD